MKKILVRLMAVMTAILIALTFSSCSLSFSADDNEYIDFLLNGWDGTYETKEEAPKEREPFKRPVVGEKSRNFWGSRTSSGTSYTVEYNDNVLANTDI